MQRLQWEKKARTSLSEDVEQQAKNIQKALRGSPSYSIDPEEAPHIIYRSFSSKWDVPDSTFSKRLFLDDFPWSDHKNSLEQLQKFFHGHVEYSDLRGSDFSVGIRVPPGLIDTVFFDNVARQVFENLTIHMEMSLQAFAVFKAESNNKQRKYPKSVKEVARRMAVEYQALQNTMPTLSAMAINFYRVVKSITPDNIPSVDSIPRSDFDVFIMRDSSYRLLLHNFLKLRQALDAYNLEPDIRREINRLQREETQE